MRHGLSYTDGHREKKLISLAIYLSSIETAYLYGDSIFFKMSKRILSAVRLCCSSLEHLRYGTGFLKLIKTLECKTFYFLFDSDFRIRESLKAFPECSNSRLHECLPAMDRCSTFSWHERQRWYSKASKKQSMVINIVIVV